MLDVHVPHHALKGWRDFLIHLATITVGLLIALGLEAGVEAWHHHRQLEETRQALAREQDVNLQRFAHNVHSFRYDAAVYANNLLVLHFLAEHPGTKPELLPGVLVWDISHARMESSAWQAAQQTGITSRMPQEEVMRAAAQYAFFDRIDKAHEEEGDTLTEALAYNFHDPDPTHLTPAQISAEIALTEHLLSRHLRYGYLLQNLSEQYPVFRPSPTTKEMEELLHLPELRQHREFAIAQNLTNKRIEAMLSAFHASAGPAN
jgi:hypothetical protein